MAELTLERVPRDRHSFSHFPAARSAHSELLYSDDVRGGHSLAHDDGLSPSSSPSSSSSSPTLTPDDTDSVSNSKPPSSVAQIAEEIRICVRGSVFITNAITLTEREPESRFARILSSVAIPLSPKPSSIPFPPTPGSSHHSHSPNATPDCERCNRHQTLQIAGKKLSNLYEIELHYDRCPKRFLTVLNYLRTGKLDPKVEQQARHDEIQALIREAEFYGCVGMIRALQSVICRLNSPFLGRRATAPATSALRGGAGELLDGSPNRLQGQASTDSSNNGSASNPPPSTTATTKAPQVQEKPQILPPAHVTSANPLTSHFPYLKELKGRDCGLWAIPDASSSGPLANGKEDEDLIFSLE